ncbi:unnamed protein product [Parascedosporium putredinis]|uniref:NAD-specific glutamate dehydrogenase n=1 Tax=Parascedosporium putredinis TaxID=1442378 RepID=A0A9P1MBN6_9PEZI|nr:unnamed protein product [Parascedosporium putredinis]CAI7996558.1 unnamed protein product [Parascedosporium putredinis]
MTSSWGHDAKEDALAERVERVHELQLSVTAHGDHLVHFLEAQGNDAEALHEALETEAPELVAPLLGRVSSSHLCREVGRTVGVLLNAAAVFREHRQVDGVLRLLLERGNLALEPILGHVRELVLVNILKLELAELVDPVPKAVVVVDEHLLIFLESVLHFNLGSTRLIEFARLLIKLSLDFGELLLLIRQLRLGRLDTSLELVRNLALVLNLAFELLQVPLGGGELLASLGVILVKLDAGLLGLDLAHLGSINLGTLGPKLLTTDLHDFVLEKLDLRFDARGLGMELVYLLVELGNLLLQISGTLVISLRGLVLLAQLLDATVSVGKVLGGAVNLQANLLHPGVKNGDLITLVNELTGKRDDPPPLRAIGNSVGLGEILGNESVLQGMVKSGTEPVFLRPNQVEETGRVLGSLDGGHVAGTELVQADKVGAAKVCLTQVLDALLAGFDSIRDEVVEGAACGGNGNVILGINGAEIAKTTMEAVNTARLLHAHEGGEDIALGLALSETGAGLLGLLADLGLLNLALLELLELGRLVLFDGGNLGLDFGLSDRAGIGLLAENAELTLGDGNGRLLLVDLFVPGLKRLLLGGDLIGKGLRLALEALPDAGELLLLDLDLLLEGSDLSRTSLNLLAAFLDRLLCLGRRRFGVGNGLFELLAFVVEELALFVKLDTFLIELGHFLDESLGFLLLVLELLAALGVDLFELLDHLLASVMLFQFGIKPRLDLLDGLLGDSDVVLELTHIDLVQCSVLQREFVLVANVGNSLVLLVLEAVLFLFHVLNTATLLETSFVESLDLSRRLLDGRLVFRGADDILEILEQAVLVLVASLGLHLSN